MVRVRKILKAVVFLLIVHSYIDGHRGFKNICKT